MNYFLDTEFSKLPWENGSHLLSLAIVSEDGGSYFACLDDIDVNNVSDFVKQNVLPYLPSITDRKSRKVIQKEIEIFLGKDKEPTIWAIFPKTEHLYNFGVPAELIETHYSKYADYDYQLFKGIWNDANPPSVFPKSCNNLTELVSKIPKEVIPFNKKAHDPLSDAFWNYEVWKLSKKY